MIDVILKTNSLDQLEDYLRGGGDPNAVYNGWRLLMIAACYENEQCVQRLIKAGADISATDENSWPSMLHAACYYGGMLRIAKILIDHGADVNARRKRGQTPLMMAAQNGHLEVVQLLVESGASLTEDDDSGWTALDYAEQYERESVVDYLRSAMVPYPDVKVAL